MANKLTWGNLIKKIITNVLTVFIFWAIGSNFVYMAGRSKPNKFNNYADAYNPGWFDWPYNTEYMPYNDQDPINAKDLGQDNEYKKFRDHMEKFKDEQSGGQFGGAKQTAWNSYLRETFSSMKKSGKSHRKTPKRNRSGRKSKSRKVYRGGASEGVPVEATPVEATPIEATPVEATPVEATPVEAIPVEATPVPEKTSDSDSLVDESDKGNAANFLGLSLAAQTEVVKKIYFDFEHYYGKGGYGGETNTDDEVDGQGRKLESLGILGKLYLNLGLTSNKYGFPYNLQQDGRTYKNMKGETKKRPVYNDGVLFGDENFNVKSSAKSEIKSGFDSVKTNNFSKNTQMKGGAVPDTGANKETTKGPEKISQSTAKSSDGKKSKKEREELPEIPNIPLDATIIDKLYNFAMGGWTKLFTGGAPDIFSWVQQTSWSTHRWLINGALGLISTFYDDKPSGLMWLFIGFLIHISPIFLLTIFPYVYGYVSYVITFCLHYGYGFTKDNHILSGWFWAGNIFFLPLLLLLATWWIPILNIFTIPISIITSLIPSLQTLVVPAITAVWQTFRSLIYLSFGHLFTPNGKQFYLGNIFGDYRYRGLFILELALAISYCIKNYLPYDDNIRTAAGASVMLSWGLFQAFAWFRGNSGWKGFWVDPSAPQKIKKTTKA